MCRFALVQATFKGGTGKRILVELGRMSKVNKYISRFCNRLLSLFYIVYTLEGLTTLSNR